MKRAISRNHVPILLAASCLTPLWSQDPAQDPKALQASVQLNPALLQKFPALANVEPLVQVSSGGHGCLVGLGKDGTPYIWQGAGWNKLPGLLAQISARAHQVVNGTRVIEMWGVNAAGAVFTWQNGTWQDVPRGPIQVALAKSGTAVFGITPAGGVVRWASGWQPIAAPSVDGSPVLFSQIGASNDSIAYAMSRGGYVYRLVAATGAWRRLGGPPSKAARLALGIDGTIGLLGRDGKFFVRQAQDVEKEANAPPGTTVVPNWTPQEEPAAGIEVLDQTTSFTVDSQGFTGQLYVKPITISPAPPIIAATPPPPDEILGGKGTLTIVSSTLIVTGANSTVGVGTTDLCHQAQLNNPAIICSPLPDQSKPEPATCINISADAQNILSPSTAATASTQTMFTWACKTGTFSKVQVKPPDKRRGPITTLDIVRPDSKNPQGAVGFSFLETSPAGLGCSSRVFGASSHKTWVEFRLPIAEAGRRIQIPGGAHAKYVFPACHRAYWSDLTFECKAATGKWELVSGRFDADGLCHGSPGSSPYVVVGDR